MTTESNQAPVQGEQTQTASQPVPGTPEYAAAMAALYDAQVGGQQTQGGNPAPTDAGSAPSTDTPGQSGEAGGTQEAPKGDEQQTNETKADEQPQTDEDKAKQEAEAKALDERKQAVMSFATSPEFNKEVYEDGQLSDKSLKTLESFGIPQELSQQIAQAFRDSFTLRKMTVHNYAGGEQQFNELVQWGQKNLSTKEWQFLDAQINGENYQAALDVLMFRRSKTSGDPQTFNVTGAGSVPVGYASQAEMVRDMGDPRYATDPAFRAQVQQKLKLSNF